MARGRGKAWWLGGLAGLVLAATGLAGAQPAKGDDAATEGPTGRAPAVWQEVTRKNLFAMRELLLTHSPIPLAGGDPAQDAWLEQGYQEALALIPRVRDELGLLYVLRRYALGFDDIHLDVRQEGPSLINRWPGFVAARQGQDTVVSWRRSPAMGGEPPEGARILSCDGQPIEALVQQGLFRFWRSPGFSKGYLQATTRLFFDNGSGFFPPPRACRMVWEGEEREVRLVWRDVDWADPTFQDAYRAADGATPATWGISSPAPGVTWIGVPSFMDDGTQALPTQFVEIVDDLRRNRGQYRAGRAIVVDLRGNTGGLRGGSNDLAEALFSADGARRAQGLFVSTGWLVRISDDNVSDILAGTEDALSGPRPENADGADAQAIGWIYRGALRNNQESLALGPPPAASGGGLTARRQGQPPPAARDNARIYVLVNETCLSACLWFLDVAAFMPGVTIVGGVTGADGALTWARMTPLPEPGMSLLLPMMEPRGSARGAGEAYAPDIAYPGVWEDGAVRAWVLGLIDAERPARLDR